MQRHSAGDCYLGVSKRLSPFESDMTFLYHSLPADNKTMNFFANRNSLHQISATLLRSLCYHGFRHLEDVLCVSSCIALEVCIPETWVHCIDDNKGGFSGRAGHDGADREILGELLICQL